jgi:hypothetical protein
VEIFRSDNRGKREKHGIHSLVPHNETREVCEKSRIELGRNDIHDEHLSIQSPTQAKRCK